MACQAQGFERCQATIYDAKRPLKRPVEPDRQISRSGVTHCVMYRAVLAVYTARG